MSEKWQQTLFGAGVTLALLFFSGQINFRDKVNSIEQHQQYLDIPTQFRLSNTVKNLEGATKKLEKAIEDLRTNSYTSDMAKRDRREMEEKFERNQRDAIDHNKRIGNLERKVDILSMQNDSKKKK